MKKAVLADAGPLYAALDPSDGRHGRAQADIERLDHEGRGVAVAFPTLCEAHSLVLRKLGAYRAREWLRELRAYASVVNPVAEDYEQATNYIAAYGGEKLSVFDAVTAVMSERLALPVWTYDYDFYVMQTEVWHRE